MGKRKLTKQAKNFFEAIVGFTTKLEKELSYRSPTRQDITLDRVTRMPTYEFAIFALENNSPTQVIKVIKTIKKRYFFRNNIDKKTLGFLDSIEGKAYGYITLNVKNVELQEEYYKLAKKCFTNAYNKGYYDAMLDLADLDKKMGNPYKGEKNAFTVLSDSKETYTRLGEMFYDFSSLVESAIRVLEGKRAIISDIYDFEYAMGKYRDGSSRSINSKFYYGLALIINNKGNDRNEGLKIIDESFYEFRMNNIDINKVLFATDVKIFNDNLDLVENKIIRRNIR